MPDEVGLGGLGIRWVRRDGVNVDLPVEGMREVRCRRTGPGAGGRGGMVCLFKEMLHNAGSASSEER